MIEDSLKDDPALAPFLTDDYVSKDADDDFSNRDGYNEVEKGSTFPIQDESFYDKLFEKTFPNFSEEEFKSEIDRLLGILGRIYNKDNHSANIKEVQDEYSKEVILKQLLCVLAGEKSYNSVILGGNINEYVYYSAPNSKLFTIFSRIQYVDWGEGGEKERKKRLGIHYSILVKDCKKFVKQFKSN